jgi:hypothetical protein
MKRLIPLAALLFLTVASAPVFALDRNDPGDRDRGRHQSVIDDVVRMAQAGVSDEAIISYVVHSRDRFDVSADDVIAMNNAHVSSAVVKVVMDEANANRRDDRRTDTRNETRTTERVVVAAPYYGWYDPFYYPYYDPFFYGPRVSLGFGFGGGFYRGGGFHGGGGGGHHGRH